jgi:hypothetical protein
MEEPVIQSISPSHAVASWRNIAVMIWRGVVDVRAAQTFMSTVLSLARKYPHGIGGIHILEATTTIPSAEVRSIMGELAEALHDHPTAGAFVAEGHDLRATIARSIGTGVTMVLRKRSGPFKVFSSMPQASSWIAAELAKFQQTATPRDVEAMVEAVRAQLG